MVYRKPNLLLLDEPTNHLDLDLRHALEIALQDYAGALVLVSHDRHLLESTCDTLWRVAGGGVQPFDGDLDDYARWLTQREREYDAADRPWQATAVKARLSPKEQRRASADQRARDKALRESVTRLEAEMAGLQSRLAALEQELLDPGLYANAERGRSPACKRNRRSCVASSRGPRRPGWRQRRTWNPPRIPTPCASVPTASTRP